MVLDQELVTFNEMPSVMKKHNTFIQHYGDGFISGFISGGGKLPINRTHLTPSYWLYEANSGPHHYHRAEWYR